MSITHESPLIQDITDFLAFERNDTLIAHEVDALTVPVQLRRADEVVLLRDGTIATSPAWGIWVCGYRMGGRHGQYSEALAHAFRCAQWSARQREEWIALNRALGVAAA